MVKKTKKSIFDTDKRIKLGIWGLGRGMAFYKSCAALNIDVVAGCDYNEGIRERFLKFNPGTYVTDDADEFLKMDMDAVLVATFCPAHASDAIRCLDAGKHVLSEVTAFHTLAEGVELVEKVESTGLVYNLAENYPFSKPMFYLASKWHEGLFGDLMYSEFEYVHECRVLAYTNIDKSPIVPGNTVHNWRSWLHFHYYNTHSLGPVMYIGDVRPTRVVSLPTRVWLPGYLTDPNGGMKSVAPSLISFDNGGQMRNLMGATTNDSHVQRIWGTLGAAEYIDGQMRFRLGAAGQAPKLAVEPEWPMLTELAAGTGHGGGDFWVLYFFARQILTGEPAPFDIYSACDCTIPGMLAYRSSVENGQPYDVPDFRNKSDRDKYRKDDFAQRPYDVKKGCFPKRADKKLTLEFSTIMRDLIEQSTVSRAAIDWVDMFDDVKEKQKVLDIVDAFVKRRPKIVETVKAARRLADAYPRSDGAQVLREMLEIACEEAVLDDDFLKEMKKKRTRMKRKLRNSLSS